MYEAHYRHQRNSGGKVFEKRLLEFKNVFETINLINKKNSSKQISLMDVWIYKTVDKYSGNYIEYAS